MPQPFTFPTADQIREARMAAAMGPAPAPAPAPSGPTTSELMAARHAEDQAELRAFQAAVAEHFGCPEMVDDHFAGRLKTPFEELRQFAHHRRAEAERRAATAGRDASGRFTGS